MKFTPSERKSVLGLSGVVALRMVGLFLVVPVLALHAGELAHSTPYLIGLALGIYGLSQAIFQIPFGVASDTWGRKRILTLGLIIFAAGSVVAAEADSIYGIVLGRALQGGGAIAAVVLAFIGDLTKESQRPKAMAILGASIGSAFTLALMLGPVLVQWLGIRGLFWISFAMAAIGLLLVWTVVDDEPTHQIRRADRYTLAGFKRVFRNKNLILLSSGTFTIHAVMTAIFLAYPLTLIEASNLDASTTWKVFVPVLLLSFVAMLPLIRISSNAKHRNSVTMLAASLLVISQCILFFGASSLSFPLLVFGLWLYFVGFNVLEAMLPSITIENAPEGQRGTAMGMFSTSTFAGAFFGGVFGGIVYSYSEPSSVFLFLGVVLLLWIISMLVRQPFRS